MKGLFTEKDCIRSMYDPAITNVGCIAIVKPEILKPEYRTKENQLVRLNGGFGCNPSASGNACFVSYCIDGIKSRVERYDLIGIANEEVTEYAEELEKEHSLKTEYAEELEKEQNDRGQC